MNVSYIKPDCVRFYYDENNKKIYKEKKSVKGIAYTSDGFILPCCWCDRLGETDFVVRGFKNNELRLKNHNSIDDVITSDVWKNFINTILHKPENAPQVCRKKCGVPNE